MNTGYTTNRYRACLIMVVLAILVVGCSKKDKSKATQSSSSGAARDSMTTYRAFGNEPFWSVTIDSNGLRFISPEDSAGVSFPAVEPVANGDTLRWTSKSEKGGILVLIWRGSCSDGMSDKTWSHASAVKLNETSYVGCAEASTRPLR